jgi:hypothetical protein
MTCCVLFNQLFGAKMTNSRDNKLSQRRNTKREERKVVAKLALVGEVRVNFDRDLLKKAAVTHPPPPCCVAQLSRERVQLLAPAT